MSSIPEPTMGPTLLRTSHLSWSFSPFDRDPISGGVATKLAIQHLVASMVAWPWMEAHSAAWPLGRQASGGTQVLEAKMLSPPHPLKQLHRSHPSDSASFLHLGRQGLAVTKHMPERSIRGGFKGRICKV